MRQIRLAPIAALLLLFATVAVAQGVATEVQLAAAVQPAQAPARPGAFFPPDEAVREFGRELLNPERRPSSATPAKAPPASEPE